MNEVERHVAAIKDGLYQRQRDVWADVGKWATESQREQELAHAAQARFLLDQLRAQVTEETPQADQRRLEALTGRLLEAERQQASEPATPWRGTQLDQLEADIRRAEHTLGDVENPRKNWQRDQSIWHWEMHLGRAAGRIGQLRPQVAEGEEHERLGGLTKRFDQQQRLLDYDKLYDEIRRSQGDRSTGPPSRQRPGGESQPMSMLGPEDVGGTPGRHGGPVDVPALPPSPDQPPPGRLPGFQPASPKDLNPNPPDLRPPEVDTGLDGYPARDPISVRDQTYHRGRGQAQAATTPQATSSGTWAAVSTKWAPAGLAVALAALLAVGCKGAPCSNLLRPALPGVPATPVPGHLQG
jgi:hypothetical protein